MELTVNKLSALVGVVGSVVAGAFGGWTSAMATLCICMVIDYLTGVLNSLVFGNSAKTKDGAFESNACFKGLLRKFLIVVIVYVCHRIDLETGANYLRDGACMAFLVNELLSIVENCGLMGLPIPPIVMNGISVLKQKSGLESDEDETE